jgi:hypothetical protein
MFQIGELLTLKETDLNYDYYVSKRKFKNEWLVVREKNIDGTVGVTNISFSKSKIFSFYDYRFEKIKEPEWE